MKPINLFLLFALAFLACANLCAQVTIGGVDSPKAGAILDLNSTLKGGLLLSNVELGSLYEIPYDGTNFPDMDDGNYAEKKGEFTGAMIYHTGVNNIPAGVYIWSGVNWTPISENCRALTSDDLILSALLLAKVNTPVTFSASSKLSQRCAEGETYEWSATGQGLGPATFTPSSSGSTVTANFPSEGSYTVTVTAKNSYMSGSITKDMTVTVSDDGNIPPVMRNDIYGLTGPTCLDVKKPNVGQNTTDVYDARIDAFPGNNFAKNDYTFVHGGEYSNLDLTLDDPNGLVASITPPAVSDGSEGKKSFTVTFKENIRDRFTVNGNSMTVKLVARYTDSDSNDKIAYLEIRLQDGYCICPVPKTNGGGWINFMCHNLGAKYDIISSSQLVTRDHHGDWYRFGVPKDKQPSLVNDDVTYAIDKVGGIISGWENNSNSSYPLQNGSNWATDDDPCPAGWRLPTGGDPGSDTELADVYKTTGTSFPSDDWNTTNRMVNNFGNFRKFGDYLYLPAAGYRINDTGALSDRGTFGYYWSSTMNDNSNAYKLGFISSSNNDGTTDYHTGGVYGLSVRCVAK
jgi:uncharacterized protein (TIGR02145 family)